MTYMRLIYCLLLAASCVSPSIAEVTLAAARYQHRQATDHGIGKIYMGREISGVMGHRGARWLDRDARKTTERTDLLLDLLAIGIDTTVADIGAGTGYFTLPIARRVTRGEVLAVDIQPEMLALLKERALTQKLKNIKYILGKEDDPLLPSATVDLVLLVDAYHEFEFPIEMAAAIKRGLRTNGKVVVVEYREEDLNVPILKLHKMSATQVIAEWTAAGFVFVEQIDELPQQHMLVFKKP